MKLKKTITKALNTCRKLFDDAKKLVFPTGGIDRFRFDPKKPHTYHFNKKGNTKLGGRIFSFSTLMADYTYKGMRGVLKNIVGTCKNCAACATSCYVRSSYRYPNVIFAQAVNTWGMRNEIDKVENDLAAELAQYKPEIVRLNQSGELEDDEQMAMWCRLAKAFPDVKFYIYTKMFSIAEKFLLGGLVPENFTVNYSVWHEVGVKEYEKVKHLPNVKAFVYDDGKDFILKTKYYCPAYKIPAGKTRAVLNHDFTCETCRLCITGKVKVIACHDH